MWMQGTVQLLEDHMRTRILPALAMLAMLPTALQAQNAEERIAAAMQYAQNAGIPVSLLDSKVQEGKAKGIPMDRIAAAVERRAEALAQAQAVMASGGDDLSEADLVAGADALGANISAKVLQTISETAPRERRAVAITALTELVLLEYVPEEALQMVIEALQRGPDALASLPGQAAEAAERRGAPAGVGGAPAGVGAPAGTPTGAPGAVPTPGQLPGSVKPSGAQRPGGS
jgi:hypothetical protein